MTTSTPKTIAAVFRTHGIGIGISVPIMQIQELALAVSLNGRQSVDMLYIGGDHTLRVSLWERRVDPNEDNEWLLLRRLVVTLPRDNRQATHCLEELADIVDTLNHYLGRGNHS